MLVLLSQATGFFRIPTGFAASAKPSSRYTISGTVYDDYNQNGTRDAAEPGVNGIIATAYDHANQLVATDATKTIAQVPGLYTLTIPEGTGPVRVQFTNFGANSTLPQLVGFQSSNHKGGTTVAFVDGAQATNTLNLGIERPAEFCDHNPQLATSCYVKGDQSDAGSHVIVRFPYSSSGDTSPPTPLASASEVGETWGLAYRRSSDSLFAASYMKRHSGFKPGGHPGAIYLIRGASSTTPKVDAAPFADLPAGQNAHNQADYQVDASAYDAIGKVSLGGMALSDDETTLYVANLANRQLYTIPVGAPPAPPVAGQSQHTAIPVPADCPEGDFRPFAVTAYNNIIYVGAVCSAESTVTKAHPAGDPAKLQAYVLAYTPGTGFAAQPVFQFPLNYPRRCANDATSPDCMKKAPAAWNAWHPTYTESAPVPAPTYPQPMLASIAFDAGNMILGLRDRFGDQMGYGNPRPRGGPSVKGITAGDTLRACLNTPLGWSLESNGSCGGVQTQGKANAQGPAGGEFYVQDGYYPNHDEVTLGSVLQVPGLPGVISTAFDPTDQLNTAGTRTFDNTTGMQTNAYQLFSRGVPDTFGKSNGLGSLVALCQSAPLEIGDRVWYDTNGNGIQDPGESAIAGVTVHLYDATGAKVLQTTKTDTAGRYYFTVAPYTKYVIKLDNAADYATGSLKGEHPAPANRDRITHSIDSKVVMPTSGIQPNRGVYPQITVDPHLPGQNDYTLDIGFSGAHPDASAPDLSITKTHQGGNSFAVGQSITYSLIVKNVGGAAEEQPSLIFVSDYIPAGFSNLTVTSTSDWQTSIDQTTSPSFVSATYMGSQPVAPGVTLPAITVTGTLTSPAVPVFINVATVAVPDDSNFNNNTATDLINVSTAPTPTPPPTTPTPTPMPPTPAPTPEPSPTSVPLPTPTPTPGYPGLPPTGGDPNNTGCGCGW